MLYFIYNKTFEILTSIIIKQSLTTTWEYLKKLRKIKKFINKKKTKIHEIKEQYYDSPIVKR